MHILKEPHINVHIRYLNLDKKKYTLLHCSVPRPIRVHSYLEPLWTQTLEPSIPRFVFQMIWHPSAI